MKIVDINAYLLLYTLSRNNRPDSYVFSFSTEFNSVTRREIGKDDKYWVFRRYNLEDELLCS